MLLPSSLFRSVRMPRLLALLGSLVFGLQLFAYAHTQTTFVDEGMYLYLGYRFVSGSLSYADLGAWNYYAPLSYFLPGLARALRYNSYGEYLLRLLQEEI